MAGIVITGLVRACGQASLLDKAKLTVLLKMSYNIVLGSTSKFPSTIKLVVSSDVTVASIKS